MPSRKFAVPGELKSLSLEVEMWKPQFLSSEPNSVTLQCGQVAEQWVKRRSRDGSQTFLTLLIKSSFQLEGMKLHQVRSCTFAIPTLVDKPTFHLKSRIVFPSVRVPISHYQHRSRPKHGVSLIRNFFASQSCSETRRKGYIRRVRRRRRGYRGGRRRAGDSWSKKAPGRYGFVRR